MEFIIIAKITRIYPSVGGVWELGTEPANYE